MSSPAPFTGPPIEVTNLTKRFGPVRAVEDLTFTVQPGRVTGFLGPNGSGKTTTLRMLLGLVTPTSGTATIGGRPYAELAVPGRIVGASLEASAHPGRTARGHLATLAPMVGADKARIEEILALVGLTEAANRRVGGFSMGMKQRLGLAGTLLGDPPVLVLDEPTNGLDPAGIVWLRDLLRHLAAQGRTVLVSSHVLAEVQATVDDVVLIAQGRLVHASTLAELVAMSRPEVRLAGPQLPALAAVMERQGWGVVPESGALRVRNATTAQVGRAVFAAGLEIHELSAHGANLEETFLELVQPAAVQGLTEPGKHSAVEEAVA